MSNIAAQLEEQTEELQQASVEAARYRRVRERLEQSGVVKEYLQPVVLLGPRSVGKTSLTNSLHTPWRYVRPTPTSRYRSCRVPFYDQETPQSEPHFADEQILTHVSAHLQLEIFDFPGEMSAQRQILSTAEDQTQILTRSLGANLGIVFVCMLDASEVFSGISNETRQYFTGEFFANLRDMVSSRRVAVQRIIVVFNKADLARNRRPSMDDEELLRTCIAGFEELLAPLQFVVNGDRICEVLTVLSQDSRNSNRGASVIVGEAAVGLVRALFGEGEVTRVVPDRATNSVSALWPGLR